jgi:hypothetical protein
MGAYEIVPGQPSLRKRGTQPNADDMWAADTEGSMAEDGFLYIQLCCAGVRLKELPHEQIENYTRVLAVIAKGASDVESIAAETRYEHDRAREILARLIEMGVVKRKSDALSLEFPVFSKQDCDILFPAVDSLAATLSSDVLKPAAIGIEEKLRQAGYDHLKELFPVWHRWMVCFIAGEALHELFKRDVLPDPGTPVPVSFGKIGLSEPHDIVSF